MENLTSKKRLPLLKIAEINLKHNSLLSVAVSAALLFLIPLIAGTANLDRFESAVPLEMFASLMGIAMLTPVFGPEQNADIDDLVSSKYVSATKICLIRVIYSIVILALLMGLFSAYMVIQGCDVPAELYAGALSDAVFLGALGMAASALTGSTVVGYMIPMFFYSLNYGLGNKLGNFYLFSMATGNFVPKLWLLTTGILLTAASLLFKHMLKKLR